MSATISNEDCVNILKNYSLTNDVKLISYELKSISEDVEGFMGEHNKLVITYEEENVQKSKIFFVKSKPTKSKTQEEITEGFDMYNKEIFMYEILIKEFEKYGYDTSFSGKSYYSIPNAVLVMEDLTESGFSLTERSDNLSMDHMKCALKSIALYHAAGYALEKTKEKELKRKFSLGEEYSKYLKEVFFIQYIDQSMYAMNSWKGAFSTLDVLIDLLPQTDSYKKEFKELVDNIEFGKAFASNVESKINKTCGHGDLWSNNMLFKYENNLPMKCCLVDFQISRYFYPCLDVFFAIFGNTNLQYRKLHLDELYLFYHKTLSHILKDYGYDIEDIHPLKDFYYSIDLIKVEALMQIFLIQTIVLLPKSQIKDLTGHEIGMQEILLDNSKFVAKSFQNDAKYREKISEILYELKKAFVERCNKK